MPAVYEDVVLKAELDQSVSLEGVCTKDLLAELQSRIDSGLYGVDIEGAFDILDRRRVPIWLLQNDTWFFCYKETDPQTIGRVISGGKQTCDVLVGFVRKWGNTVNERCHISSMSLVRPIKPEEVPPSCFVKTKKGETATKPVIEAVACVGLDDIFSEPQPATVDDLFSE